MRYSTSNNCVTFEYGLSVVPRSLKMEPFDRSHTTYSYYSIQSATSSIFRGVTTASTDPTMCGISRSSEWHNLTDRIRVPIDVSGKYGSILYHFQDKARYWVKNRDFVTPQGPAAFDAPVRGGLPVGIWSHVWYRKSIMVSIADGEKFDDIVYSFLLRIGYTNMLDGRTCTA